MIVDQHFQYPYYCPIPPEALILGGEYYRPWDNNWNNNDWNNNWWNNNWNNPVWPPYWYPNWNNNWDNNYWQNPWWDNNNWNNFNSNMITWQRAVEIALQRIPGQVIKVEMDTENGRLVYEVNIRTSQHIYEVKVDAYIGQVLKVEIED